MAAFILPLVQSVQHQWRQCAPAARWLWYLPRHHSVSLIRGAQPLMAISDLPSPPEIAVRLVYSGILALCRVRWWLLQVECMFSAAALQALMRWLCFAALPCAVATAAGFQLGHP